MRPLFPARAFGPNYFKDLLAPLPHLKLLATGGVNLENMEAYFNNGVKAVGVGSNLVDPVLIDTQDWDGLTAKTAKFVQAANEARG